MFCVSMSHKESHKARKRVSSQHFLPWSSPWPVGTYVLIYSHTKYLRGARCGKDSAVTEVWSCPWSLFPPTLNSSINRFEKLDRMSTSF